MIDLPKPFNEGLWILCMIGGRDFVAQVDDSSETEESLKKQLVENKCICVTLSRKLWINVVHFPMRAQGVGGQQGFTTGNLVTVMAHERAVECFNRFPTHCVLHAVTFLSDLDIEDIKILATTALQGETAADTERRANKSNIQLVKG